MSLSDFAKTKALEYIEGVIRQADQNLDTSTGTPVKSLFILPASLMYAAIFQDLELLRTLYLSNFSEISDAAMDQLAANLGIERSQGSRSIAMVRIYTDEIEEFELTTYPYFSTELGIEFTPVQALSFTISDYVENDGSYYVSVPVISTTSGLNTRVDADTIIEFKNMPITIRSVTNPAQAQGGSDRPTNAEFFEEIQESFNANAPSQIGGLRDYIRENYQDVAESLIIPAGNDSMVRDEIWTSDGTNPNIDREGEPFASHTSLSALDFTASYGRAYSAAGEFTDDMEGKRIAIDGDDELFRNILNVIDENYAIVSGHPLEETSVTAEVWEEGPKILSMADVYLYTPAVQIKSTTVDKRYRLNVAEDSTAPVTKIYYNIASGFSYDSIPTSGKLVVLEGSADETVFTVTARGTDADGDYLTVDSSNESVSSGSSMSLYDMDEISIGDDIESRPVLYVLQIDKLDPLSFESVEEIARTAPGSYDDPGWYMKNTDPAEVFSTRENKTIVLDSKEDESAFEEINISPASIISTSYRLSGTTETTSEDNQFSCNIFGNYEGREVTVTTDAFTLQDESSTALTQAVSGGAGTSTLTMGGTVDIKYLTSVGFRDDVRVLVYDSGSSLVQTFEVGDVMVYGNTFELKTGAFHADATTASVIVPNQSKITAPTTDDIAWFDDALYKYDGISWIEQTDHTTTPFVDEYSLEVVVTWVNAAGTAIEVYVEDGGLQTVYDAGGYAPPINTTVTAESEVGEYNQAPVRVTYATHNDFSSLQTVLDSGDVQLLCKDTLARSFYPSLIDSTIRFSGDQSAQNVYDRFVELVSDVAVDTDDGFRLDISNIVAALDEEGFTDSIAVNFEIKVTNFLNDGEHQVRYINPSESTKQSMALSGAYSAGEDRVTVRRVDTTADLPGRGKIFLGGNNPSTQEVIPYEAVIDNGDDTYTIIFRRGFTTTYSHVDWETVFVTVRDYDPQLEFTEGAIYIPSTNRPYVRDLVVIKTS